MINDNETLARARQWLSAEYDETTQKEVKRLIESDLATLNEAFYRGLEFGTAGMRGIMGVGTNRMNVYTVGMATQGLANYLKAAFRGAKTSVAVAYDNRNNSRLFAETAADIFAANGIEVHLFESLRPTPELSFAIRELGCQSGVVITASHNPKEYNGYKAYWGDGAQVTPPHDKNIIAEVNKITSMSQVLRGGDPALVHILGQEFDDIYLDRVESLSLSPEAVEKHRDMTIVYTPLHGAGVILVPAALKRYGFTNVHTVKEQNIVDGDFPTVVSPNPEERSAMTMALELARKVDAELVLATDPDADRLGIAVKDDSGEFVILNGNQTATLLTYYICRRWSELGRIDGRQYIVKTIVTTQMMADVARSFGLEARECLTGFKYIAEIIRDNEPELQYVCGGEESFGFLPCDFVRDKDAVCSVAMAAEAAAWAREQGTTLWGLLKQLYVEFGFYRESMFSVVRPGQAGVQEIADMMTKFRVAPPTQIAGSQVVNIRDYLSGFEESIILDDGSASEATRQSQHNTRHSEPAPSGAGVEPASEASPRRRPLNMERSNVLQFLTADGTIVSVRPSGTEPKIKFYFGIREPLPSLASFDAVEATLDAKIERMKEEFQ